MRRSHWKTKGLWLTAIVLGWLAWQSPAAVLSPVKGFTLTEIGDHRYDAYEDPALRTEAQIIVDRLYSAGVRHINLSPRAIMQHPRNSYVIPMTSEVELPYERDRYVRLIRYIHSKGMTVGMRPIFFVVDAFGNIPYIEPLAGGGEKVWWHGNVQPTDPEAWFASFARYLEIYADIARETRIAEFTIGAELESLTVGIGGEWPDYPMGFPGEWVKLLSHTRARLHPECRVMYDINYTDNEVMTASGPDWGGELVVWRNRIVDGANPADPALNQAWKNLVTFWRGLDAVGIDMYRSLAVADDVLPEDYTQLVLALRRNTDEFAAHVDDTLGRIAEVVGVSQDAVLKELGYRSVERGFIDPFTYAGPGNLNVLHQAAAYEAVLSSFDPAKLSWFKGVVFWDASVDLDRHGPFDVGFSPIGKDLTEAIMRRFFETP